MLVDWFTLAAQIVNFLILVWLLKRFLWGRLIRAIDDRENRIAARLAGAAQKEQEAAQRMAEADVRAAGQERQCSELMARAQREAGELRLELAQRAREDVRKQEEAWSQDLEREKSVFLDDVRKQVAAEILALVRRVLADLACADVQRCAAEAFLERLQAIDIAALRQLASGGTIFVLSASDLPGEIQQKIESVLAARLGQPAAVEFARDPAMTWGLELRSGGRSIGWTPESYLDSLDSRLRKALEARPKVLVG